MNQFQKNIESIKNTKVKLYEKIVNILEMQQNGDLNVEYGKAENGEPCLYVQRKEKIYRMNSEVSPSFEAKRWSEQYDSRYYQSIIEVFGIGSGYFLRELLEKYPEETIFLVYEPSKEIFLSTLCNCDLSDILTRKNVIVFIGEDELPVYEKLLQSLLSWNTMSFQLQIAMPEYENIFKDEYALFLKEIKEAVRDARMQLNTEIVFAESMPRNTLYNIRHLTNASLACQISKEKSSQIPVILVAAGPSLDKNIEMIRKAKGHAFIVAVDRAINSLLDKGIIPDATATIDPEKSLANYEKKETETIPLFCILESNYQILNKHKGKKIIMHNASCSHQFFHQFGYTEPPIAISGSVATNTFSTLLDIGFETIILVGQDLAIYGEQTHAKEALKGNRIFRTSKKNRIIVPANDGGEVETREDFYKYLKWYSERISLLSENVTIVNATEGGAFIEGTKVMTLKNALEQYCTEQIDIPGLVNEIPLLLNDSNQLNNAVDQMMKELLSMQKETKEAMSLTYDLIQNAVQKGCQNSKARKLGEKVSTINQKILGYDTYRLVDSMLSSNINYKIADIYATMDNVYEDTRKTYDYSKYLYEAMIPCIEQLIEYLEDTNGYIKG